MSSDESICVKCGILSETSYDGTQVVCTSCGMVLEDSQVSEQVEHFDRSYLQDRQTVSSFSPSSSFIGARKGINKPISCHQQIYKNRVWEATNRICSALGLPPDIVSDVKSVANHVFTSKLPNPGYTRLIPAAVYFVSRQRNFGLALIDVADACGVSPFSVGRWYRKLVDRLGASGPSDLNPSFIVENCICHLLSDEKIALLEDEKRARGAASTSQSDLHFNSINNLSHGENASDNNRSKGNTLDIFNSRFDDDLDSDHDWKDQDMAGEMGELRQKAINSAQRLIALAKEDLLFTGRHPGPAAAAVAILALKSSPLTRNFANLEEVACFVKSSERTIMERMVELKRYLFNAATTTLPWASNLKKNEIEDKIPIILQHLEIEAKFKAVKMSVQESNEASKNLQNAKSTGALPAVSSSATMEKRGKEDNLGTLLPRQVTSSKKTAVDMDFTVTIPMHPVDDAQPSPPSSANPKKRIGPLLLLPPSKIQKVAEVMAPGSFTNATNEPSDDSSFIESPSNSSQTVEADYQLADLASIPDIPLTEEFIPQESNIETKQFVQNKPVSYDVLKQTSAAPSYALNVLAYSKRALQIANAKKRLAAFANTLSDQDALVYGILKFKTKELSNTPAPDVVEDVTGEDLAIEKLLMEGVDEETILSGHEQSHLVHLDSHYAAINAQYDTTYINEAIRSSAEIAILQASMAQKEALFAIKDEH